VVTPVNLNKARKAKARATKSARADENAVKFGRTKAQKDSARKEADRAVRALDNHKRES
jgi:hypothetical protein